MSIFGDIVTGLISPITTLFSKRNDNKTKITQQKIERLVSAEDKIAEWERIQSEGGAHSWKDEFWTVILSVPAIACFIPGGAIYIEAGFDALVKMPDFYQYWLGVAILTSFGIRITKR